jgi:parvulin-like peptidyl-prolyl isomerase
MRFLNGAEEAGERPIDGALDREARLLGLDVNDPIVRRIVVQKMRLLLARQADSEEPRDADLRDYYERHRGEYAQDPRVTLRHVFVGADTVANASAAVALLERLRDRHVGPAAATGLGQPFALGTQLRAQSALDLGKLFGSEFAAAVFALELGGWQGPLRSTHGLHLVWVESMRARRVAAFDSVRSRVRAELRAARRQERLAAELRDLRARYVVRVEPPAEARRS